MSDLLDNPAFDSGGRARGVISSKDVDHSPELWKKFEKLIQFQLHCDCGEAVTGTFVTCTVYMLDHIDKNHTRKKK